MADVTGIIVAREVAKSITKDDTFLTGSRDFSAWTQKGTNTFKVPFFSTSLKGSIDATLPLPVKTVDTAAQTITMRVASSSAVVIPKHEEVFTNFNKRAELVKEMSATLRETVTDAILHGWMRGGKSFIQASGAERDAGSGTGKRKAIAFDDILEVVKRFQEKDVASGKNGVNGIAVVTPAMYSDILKLPEFNNADRFGKAILPTGAVGTIAGFTVFVRSSVGRVNSGGALLDPTSAASGTHKDTSIWYAPQYVARAINNMTAYKELSSTYQGLIFSLSVHCAGVALYGTQGQGNKGVECIKE